LKSIIQKYYNLIKKGLYEGAEFLKPPILKKYLNQNTKKTIHLFIYIVVLKQFEINNSKILNFNKKGLYEGG
jgi:hypothetical protein